MLDHHITSPVTRQRLRSGPAAGHVDDFAEWLHRRGYKPVSIETILRSLAGWTDWMRSAGFAVHDCLAGQAACTTEVQAVPRVRYSRGANNHSLAAAALFIPSFAIDLRRCVHRNSARAAASALEGHCATPGSSL